jgi:hypothetical protein
MKKRFIVYGTIALIPLGYWGFLGYCYLTDDVSEASFQKLEIGMTRREVRSILGVWPDKSYHLVKWQTHEDWYGDECYINLAFDDDDRLVWKDWRPIGPRPTLVERWEGLFVKIRE